jgi:hypothetical protein
MRTPISLLALCIMLTVQPAASGQQDAQGKAVAQALLDGTNAANLMGIKNMAEREVYGMKDRLIQSLTGTPFGTGILFDVPVYERPEGAHWAPHPLQVGMGQRPFDIVMRSEEYGRDHGTIRNLEPAGFFFSKSKSYMLWATLKDKQLTVRTMTPENREILFASVQNRVKEPAKPTASPAKP